MKRFILILLYLEIIMFCNAAYPPVRNFSKKEYKSGAQNWAITQDENNIMYFANNSGMLVYDGKNWSTAPINYGTQVSSVLYDNHRYYASTFNDFGYFEKKEDGRYVYNTLTSLTKMSPNSSNDLFSIYKSDNNIFFQGEKTIYVYNGKKVFKHLFRNRIDASGIAHNAFFVATSKDGLLMLNGKMFVRVQGSELLLNKKVRSILPYQNDKVIIVTSFHGVYMYDGSAIVPFNTGIDTFLKTNQVFCAAINGNQIVYGTVQRGIAIQNTENNNVLFVNTFSGLQNNTVLSAAFDNQNNLWLGLDNGIDYVELNSPVLNIFGTNILYGAGYASLIKNNTLYLGTNQGLYYCSYPLSNSPIPLQLNLIKGMEGQVWSLKDIDNQLFCGNDQGTYIINSTQIERIEGLPGTWSFKQLQKHPDMILGCSYQGLFILKKKDGKWRFSHFMKGNFKESSPMFDEDEDGNIWFSHWQKGLFKLYLNDAQDSIKRVVLYNEKSGFPSNRNNTLFRVGNQIIFSSEKGFYFYNRSRDKMEPYQKLNSLFSGLPSYIRVHESLNGDLWCLSGKFFGLARKNADGSYTMDSLTYHNLQSKVIPGFEHFNFIDKNNFILATEEGFSWIDTRRRQPMNRKFKVILNNIVSTGNDPSVNLRHIAGNILTQGTFKHNQNSLRFSYVAPEYRNENAVIYSYMLENYDKTWSEYSFENIKEYNKLPRGNYVFKVKAKNLFEAEEAVLNYSFTILPAWYETTLAFIIYILLALAAITALIFFVNRESEKGAKEMEKKKEMEIQEQKRKFDEETQEKKKEIKELQNQQLKYELRHKSQELASSTMNLIRKNEILLEIIENINKTSEDIRKDNDQGTILTRLSRMERNIKANIENDNNWKKFEENFDIVYENYLKRLGDTYPELSVSDKKICAYIKMDLSSKDMAPLLNMSVRSIETNRYRIRKKMNLDRETNLAEFLQKF